MTWETMSGSRASQTKKVCVEHRHDWPAVNFWQFSLFLSMLLSGCRVQEQEPGKVAWKRCRGFQLEHALCASVKAPLVWPGRGSSQDVGDLVYIAREQSAEPSEQLSLEVMKINAETGVRKYPPLLFLSGGPGQSATRTLAGVMPYYDKLRKYRDIYAVAMRGTQGSGELTCPALKNAEKNGWAFVDDREHLALFSQCRSELKHDPRYYGTMSYINDLELVRKTFGVEVWDLHAVSYGTRVALGYMQSHPAAVGKAVLEGVTAPNQAIGDDLHIRASAQLERIARACLRQVDCRDANGDAAEILTSLLERVRAQPPTVALEIRGRLKEVLVRADDIIDAVLLHLYQPQTWSALPLRMKRALRMNELRPLLSVHNAPQAVNAALYWSVVCQEDVPYFNANGAGMGATLIPDRRERMLELCKAWGGGGGGHAGKADRPWIPLAGGGSAHKILALSGEHDPVTPPSGALQVLDQFRNSTQLVFKGMGHNVYYLPCVQRLMLDFLNGSPLQDAAKCAEGRFQMPFFSTGSGFNLEERLSAG